MSSAIMPRPLRRSSCAWQEMIFRYAPCARVSGLFAGSASRSSARTSCLSVRRDAVLSRIDRGRRPSRHRVIRAHDGVGGDVFDLFFRQLADERKASVTVATGDGAGWIDSRVAEHCPNAERVPEGFRIVSWKTGALDKVGKRLWNQARHGHDEEAAGRMRGARYTVPKNPDKLTAGRSEAFGSPRRTDPKGQPYRSWRLEEPPRTLLGLPRPGQGRAEPLGVPGLA